MQLGEKLLHQQPVHLLLVGLGKHVAGAVFHLVSLSVNEEGDPDHQECDEDGTGELGVGEGDTDRELEAFRTRFRACHGVANQAHRRLIAHCRERVRVVERLMLRAVEGEDRV